MVLRFDIPTGEIAVQAVADPQIVAVFQEARIVELLVVDERAVSAVLVRNVVAFHARLNARVLAGNRVIGEANVAIVAATNQQKAIRERVAATHRRARWVDVNQTRFPRRGGKELLRRGDPRIGDFFDHHAIRRHEVR